MFSPASPVGASSQSLAGFTSPTYTLTSDGAASPTLKTWTVSALGGTQPSGCHAHSLLNPFTLQVSRPAVLKSPTYGVDAYGRVQGQVPKNSYRVTVRTGLALTSAGNSGAVDVGKITLELVIPAGAEAYGADQMKAALLLALASASSQIGGLVDTASTGVI